MLQFFENILTSATERNIVSMLTNQSENCNSSSQTNFKFKSNYVTDFCYCNSVDINPHFIFV